MPQSGTNWNLRTSSVSWVGPGVRHFEHRPRQRFLGRTLTWSCLSLPTATSLIDSYRKPLCFSTELSRVLSSTGRPSLGRIVCVATAVYPTAGPRCASIADGRRGPQGQARYARRSAPLDRPAVHQRGAVSPRRRCLLGVRQESGLRDSYPTHRFAGRGHSPGWRRSSDGSHHRRVSFPESRMVDRRSCQDNGSRPPGLVGPRSAVNRRSVAPP
jgi:hypothetical protein